MAVWAIFTGPGQFVLRHVADGQHPVEAGHAKECEGRAVVRLEREPDTANGETVNADGRIVFDPVTIRAVLTAETRAWAARRINAISPDWRQRNDLRRPSPAGEERFDRIDAVRDRSNAMEARALRGPDDVRAWRAELNEDAEW